MTYRQFLPAFAVVLAASASAQTPPAAPDREIVVTASEPDTTAVTRQARAITKKDDLHHAPLAQFDKPICPGVVGLKPEFALPLVERMRFDVLRFGLQLDEAGECRPNVLVVFVENGQAEIRALQDSTPYVFNSLRPRERKLLAADAGPVHAWVRSELRSADGMVPNSDSTSANGPKYMRVREVSRLRLGYRRDIVQSYVMIDLAATEGLTTHQLADYAIMRGLARTEPPSDDASFATILGLFHPGEERADELTEFDVAYLKNLYDGKRNYTSSRKLDGVAQVLRKEQSGEKSRQ